MRRPLGGRGGLWRRCGLLAVLGGDGSTDGLGEPRRGGAPALRGVRGGPSVHEDLGAEKGPRICAVGGALAHYAPKMRLSGHN